MFPVVQRGRGKREDVIRGRNERRGGGIETRKWARVEERGEGRKEEERKRIAS